MSLDDKQHVRTEEILALLEWMDDNSLSGIENLIRIGDMSPAMRDIVADIFTDKIKRKSGAKTTKYRDEEIYNEVLELLVSGNNLRSNRHKDGAAQLVADSRGLKEETVVKAYQRIQSNWKPIYKGYCERLLSDVDFWQTLEEDKSNPSRKEFQEKLNKKKF